MDVYSALEATTKRLEKTEIISEYLKKLDADTIGKVGLLLLGGVFPAWSSEEIGLIRSRNWTFFSTLLPFSLIASRYGFFDLNLITEQPAEWKSLLVYAFFLLFILLRFVIYKIATPMRGNLETYRVAHRSAMNFFIVYTLFLLVTIAVLKLLNVDQSAAQKVFLWETAVIYFFYLVVKTQIFASSYGLLRTFLYLCGLELLPVAALAAAILWL